MTLDADVAARLRWLEQKQGTSADEIGNDALRRSLPPAPAQADRRTRYLTPVVHLGRCQFDSLDNVAEVLAAAEDDLQR